MVSIVLATRYPLGLTKELNAPNYLVVLAVVSVSLNGSAIYREGTSVIKVKTWNEFTGSS